MTQRCRGAEKQKRERPTGGIHSAPANDGVLSAHLCVSAPLRQAVFNRRDASNSQFTIQQARARLRHEFSRTCGGQALVAGLLLIFLLLGGGPKIAHAQETNRAGLVVVDGAGASHAYCVGFVEAEISGYELLQRAGLALSVEAGAMGATVCAIDGEGCSFPAESCFCQCQGSPCVYWSYWTQDDDGAGENWRYETLGAGNARVRDGDVQGWRWGAGTVTEAQQPPLLMLDEICKADEAAAPAGAPVTVTVAATAAAGLAGTTTPLAPVVATRSDDAAPVTANGLSAGDLLLWLGMLAVPLALGGWLLWRRSRP